MKNNISSLEKYFSFFAYVSLSVVRFNNILRAKCNVKKNPIFIFFLSRLHISKSYMLSLNDKVSWVTSNNGIMSTAAIGRPSIPVYYHTTGGIENSRRPLLFLKMNWSDIVCSFTLCGKIWNSAIPKLLSMYTVSTHIERRRSIKIRYPNPKFKIGIQFSALNISCRNTPWSQCFNQILI